MEFKIIPAVCKWTFNRSKGWVQQAAPAEANPPKYHFPIFLVLSTSDIFWKNNHNSVFNLVFIPKKNCRQKCCYTGYIKSETGFSYQKHVRNRFFWSNWLHRFKTSSNMYIYVMHHYVNSSQFYWHFEILNRKTGY